jgi:hypothetical protein
MCVSSNVWAFEFEKMTSLGILGVSIFSSTESSDVYMQGRFFNFLLQSDVGVGVSISPLALYSCINDTSIFYLTFVNLSIFYDFLKRNNFILGPFVSTNGVKYNRLDFFEFRAGLTFSIWNVNSNDYHSPDSSLFELNFFFAELGYSYNNDTQGKFYAYLGIDILAGLYVMGMGKKDVFEKYQKEHPSY